MNPEAVSQQDVQMLHRALLIANQAVLQTLVSECATEQRAGRVHYDTRPMVDPREHRPNTVDWHAELLSFGESVGLLVRHPADRYLVAVMPTLPR